MEGRQPTAWLIKAFVGVEEEMIRPEGMNGSLLGDTLEAAPVQNEEVIEWTGQQCKVIWTTTSPRELPA